VQICFPLTIHINLPATVQNFVTGGIIEHVVLLGTPASLEHPKLAAARSIISGRFVNAYSTADWLLALSFRCSSQSIPAQLIFLIHTIPHDPSVCV
jgi:hypothetical protein